LSIFEDGKESRDFIFIDDVVDATTLALTHDDANGEIFGIGAGVATDVLTVAKTLVENYGISVPIKVTGAFRMGDIRHNYADLTKAERLIGFKPSIQFSEGINRFTNWVDTQAVQKDNYDLSIAQLKERGLFK